jgi:hypothetical protein
MVVALGRGIDAAAQTLTQEEALRVAFPNAQRVERRTAYLDDAQIQRAAALAGREVEVESGVVTYYVAIERGAPVGVAYFDAHRVRTLPEVLMVVVDAEDRIRRLDVLRFAEPPEYRAPLGWLARFLGRELDDDLSARRGIAAITGATLTTRAITGAARRVLALHEVIAPLRVGSE